MRCSGSARFGRQTGLEHHDRLADPPRAGKCSCKRHTVAHAFQIDGDDVGLVVVDQRFEIIGDTQHRFVAAADHQPKAEARLLRQALHRHRRTAALAHDRNVSTLQAIRRREARSERRRQRLPGIDDPKTVGTAQKEAAIAAKLR